MNGLSPLDHIRIVLSHPSHPGNIGAAARAMKTMGLSRLTLVAPRAFPHDEALTRASGAGDLLEAAVVCATLDEALRDAVLVAGVTARRRDLAAPFRWAREGAVELVAATAGGTREVALLFGNETAGLSNEELARCHLALTIPANPGYSSLNLAAAVQLLCYELRLAAAAPGDPPQGEFLPATAAETEGLFEHFERVALDNGFLDPQNPGRLMPRLRRLFGRARLEHEEVSILRGFLTTIERPKIRRKHDAHASSIAAASELYCPDGGAVMNSSSVIRKTAADLRVTPNLADYAGERQRFSWEALRCELLGDSGGGVNIAHLAVDRHAAGPLRDKTAFRFLASDAAPRDISYGELAALSNRFCNVLRGLGVEQGERVFIVAGRIPELYVALLGSLKNGCAVSPLFSAFGPEPIATRVNLGAGSVLVTTDALYERKIAKARAQMPSLRHVLLVAEDGDATPTAITDTLDLATLLAQAAPECTLAPTQAEDMALLHFTSGTTGTPKGAVHVHGAVVTHWATGRYALDLHADDIYWCTADPGWVTGTSYGIIAPLLHGVTSVVDREEFDAERWYGILQSEDISVWYTAPTAVRMLMKAGADIAKKYAFPKLRFVASVGEPLNPEAVWWGKQALGLPIHDNWWQTETGGIMIANMPAFDIKPGSMGRPLPGIEAAIVQHQADGSIQLIDTPDQEGELALKRGWPSMFRAYLNNEERYRKSFAGPDNQWYLTGDLARRDADGYYWFVGRADDVIKSAGHLIGPFEVESALMEHPAVAEAGVIGKPDPVVGELVKAFVSLKPGYEQSEALRLELLGHARKRLGAAVAPKEIAFLAQLPRTRSGKIMRRLLKARELGLPEGDTSTLESGA